MAITEIYVDPAINANSGTGTSGDPYGDLQYALNTATRDATNGNRFNVKAGTTETLTAALSLATYGTPTAGAPLVIQGYTTNAGDGGIGVISGAGSYSIIASSTLDFIHLLDLRLTNCGANNIVQLDASCLIHNCEIDTNSITAVDVGVRSTVSGCNFHDVATAAGAAAYALVLNGIGAKALSNRFAVALGHASSLAIRQSNASNVATDNIIRLGATGGAIANVAAGDGALIMANSIYAASGTGTGINIISGGDDCIVVNNIVEGFSGSGGKGIVIAANNFVYHSNALYNNATNETISGQSFVSSNNDVLSGSAFVNAGSDDFDINGTVTGVTEDAWPSAFLGAASTVSKADKGASQAGAGTGGGGTVNPLRGKLG